jgi:hypothetical protein
VWTTAISPTMDTCVASAGNKYIFSFGKDNLKFGI